MDVLSKGNISSDEIKSTIEDLRNSNLPSIPSADRRSISSPGWQVSLINACAKVAWHVSLTIACAQVALKVIDYFS